MQLGNLEVKISICSKEQQNFATFILTKVIKSDIKISNLVNTFTHRPICIEFSMNNRIWQLLFWQKWSRVIFKFQIRLILLHISALNFQWVAENNNLITFCIKSFSWFFVDSTEDKECGTIESREWCHFKTESKINATT